MSHPPKNKKEQQKKMRKRRIILQLAELNWQNSADIGGLAAPSGDDVKARRDGDKKLKDGEERVWSDQLTEIRNRISHRKRLSEERWNRFAGTSGSTGARGR